MANTPEVLWRPRSVEADDACSSRREMRLLTVCWLVAIGGKRCEEVGGGVGRWGGVAFLLFVCKCIKQTRMDY